MPYAIQMAYQKVYGLYFQRTEVPIAVLAPVDCSSNDCSRLLATRTVVPIFLIKANGIGKRGKNAKKRHHGNVRKVEFKKQ
jgi:hypothetical protein